MSKKLRKPLLSDFGLSDNLLNQYFVANDKRNNSAFSMTIVSLVIAAIISIVNIGFSQTILFGWIVGPILFFVLVIIFQQLLLDPSMRNVEKNYNSYKDALQQYNIEYQKTQTEFWNKLNGYQFEVEVGNIYKKLGYQVRYNGGSGDGGIDLFLIKDNKIIIVQCKHHKNPVGPSVVRDLYGTMNARHINDAILVSLSGCTSGVYEFVRDKNIQIVTVNDLINMQRNMVEIEK